MCTHFEEYSIIDAEEEFQVSCFSDDFLFKYSVAQFAMKMITDRAKGLLNYSRNCMHMQAEFQDHICWKALPYRLYNYYNMDCMYVVIWVSSGG